MRGSASFLIVLAIVSRVLAWGGEGHQVVALIAEKHLSPAAQQAVHDLLGADVDISDAEIANWADQIRNSRRATAPWHYVNIPIDSTGFDQTRDGNKGQNVIDKINDFTALLADTTKPAPERAEALKYLTHFIGDLHQPLHCADRNKDKGGNGIPVTFLDSKAENNLHRVWDTQLLRQYVGKARIADYADTLDKRITKANAAEWAKGKPVEWANESLRVAAKSVYAGVPADGSPHVVTQQHIDASRPVVDQQLSRAGIRLASVLNSALAPANP